MISRRTAINLIAFFVAAVLLVLYGIVNLWDPFGHGRNAYAVFPSAGGLHQKFLVSLDGVPVGEVSGIKLEGQGVRVTMSFDKGTHIPNDVQASIIRSSAVGEQRIDLSPTDGGDGGTLANHARIPLAPQDAVPPDVGEVLKKVNDLIGQIPTGDLNSLIHEAAVGLRGRAGDLRSIVDSLTTLSNAYLAHQDNFRQLLVTSPTLLNGIASSAAQLQDALVKTETLTKLLANRRFDLVKLLRDLSSLGTVGNDFLLTNRVNLTCVLSDLADTNDFLQGANLANLETGLGLNQQFFGLVDKISPKGFAKDLGLNAPTRNDQTWLRVRTLLPPPQPPASKYDTNLPVPPTKPGAACRNVYGSGVGPVTQGANYQLLYGAQLIPPTNAEAEAPSAARTGPVSAGDATPAVLRAHSHRTTTATVSTLLLVLLGLASLGLLLFAVPFVRYRWRS
jgi:virulence factor Mce-like protein